MYREITEFLATKGYTRHKIAYIEDEEILYYENPKTKKRLNITLEVC